MKILHVIHSVNPRGGGPIEGIRQLAPALAARGYATDVLSLDGPDDPWAVDFPLPLHATGPSSLGYGFNRRIIPWLVKNHQNYKAVIVNGIWQYASLAVWRALRGTSTPYYVYPHGMLDPWFQRRYPFKHLKKCLYWRWAEYRVLRDAAAVLFTSEEEKLESRKSFHPYQCREVITGYGIASPTGDISSDRALFLEKHPELKGKRLLLFLGRIHEKKGCDLLLRAWREVSCSPLVESIPNTHLVMAGPTDHGYGTRMLDLTRKLELSGKVTWTGMITGEIKWGSIRAADAFILPSHQENFGVSVVEALACGVPVLISNKVNIWREVEQGHAGLVRPDTLAGTIQLLKDWLRLPRSEQDELRSQAQICFEKHFAIERTAEALTTLFGL